MRDVHLELPPAAITCLVGESGCGKSLTARAVLRLTPETAVLGGRALLRGEDLLSLPEKYMHTSVETIDLNTLEEGARLLANFVAELDESWEDDLWI